MAPPMLKLAASNPHAPADVVLDYFKKFGSDRPVDQAEHFIKWLKVEGFTVSPIRNADHGR